MNQNDHLLTFINICSLTVTRNTATIYTLIKIHHAIRPLRNEQQKLLLSITCTCTYLRCFVKNYFASLGDYGKLGHGNSQTHKTPRLIEGSLSGKVNRNVWAVLVLNSLEINIIVDTGE